MAATYWQSTDGDVGAASSWTNGVPSSSNTPAIADGRSQKDMTQNLDQTGAAFVFRTTPKYRGQIGSPGNPYIFEAPDTSVRHVLRGSGNAWLKTASGGVGNVVVDASRRRTTVYFDGTVNDLYVKGGTAIVLSTCQVSGIVYVVNVISDVTIQARDGSELSPSKVHVVGGIARNKRKLDASNTIISVDGGRLIQTGTLGTSVYVAMSGGYMSYEPNASTSGLSPTFAILGGVFDISGSDQTIGYTRFVVGPDGTVIGSALEKASLFGNVDLRETYP